MKLKNILCSLVIIIFMNSQITATNTNPVVTNVTFSITGTTVTVHYDVTDAEESAVTIYMEVSNDIGVTWNFNYGTASGNIGAGIATGANKTITWTYEGAYNDQFKIKIIADDLVGDQIYYSGKIYNTVTIGSQTWLKENLDVGTRINGNLDQTNNGGSNFTEKYCYNNDEAYCNSYGGLYQWAEAVQYLNNASNTTSPNPAFVGNVKGICPIGWHIPTQAELQTLATAVSNNSNALKALGQGTGSGTGTNTSGFSALLAGLRLTNGNFYDFGSGAYFGGSHEYDMLDEHFMNLWSGGSIIDVSTYASKDYGFSIRCLKD